MFFFNTEVHKGLNFNLQFLLKYSYSTHKQYKKDKDK